MLSPMKLKDQEYIWDAVNNRELQIIDPVEIDDYVECRIKGYQLKFSLSWVPSDYDYGPHWNIAVISPYMAGYTAEEWNQYFNEYDRFWYGS